MTRLTLPKLALFTAVALTVSQAYGEPGKGRFPIALGEIEARQARHFDLLDQNNDEVVTLAEFEQARGPARDKRKGQHGRRDHDRRDHGGFKHHPHDADRSAQRKALREAADAELFAILDADKDGALSGAEYAARSRDTLHLARKRAMFAQLDSNQDGQLTAAEMPSRAEHLRKADADQDGQITRQEMRAFRKQSG